MESDAIASAYHLSFIVPFTDAVGLLIVLSLYSTSVFLYCCTTMGTRQMPCLSLEAAKVAAAAAEEKAKEMGIGTSTQFTG